MTPTDAVIGETFEYEVVAYGETPDAALRDAMAWQTRQGHGGAGCARYGRVTVPVRFGPPYQPDGGYPFSQMWRVPVTWMVTEQPWAGS